MAKQTTPLTVRIPTTVKQLVDDYSDTNGRKKTSVWMEIINAGMEIFKLKQKGGQ